MVAPEKIQGLYEEVAEQCERRGDARQRDIFLVLAADAALTHGQPDQAERLRQRLIALSPHTLLMPFTRFSEAMQSADICEYVADLRRQFPPEKAEKVLHSGSENRPTVSLDSPFGKDFYPLQEPASPPTLPNPFVERPAARQPAPAPLPAKNRRRSPYESPDYGPRVPPGTGPREFHGTWIIFALAGLIILLGLGLVVYVLGKPFLGF
jgi:hypothetical protein